MLVVSLSLHSGPPKIRFPRRCRLPFKPPFRLMSMYSIRRASSSFSSLSFSRKLLSLGIWQHPYYSDTPLQVGGGFWVVLGLDLSKCDVVMGHVEATTGFRLDLRSILDYAVYGHMSPPVTLVSFFIAPLSTSAMNHQSCGDDVIIIFLTSRQPPCFFSSLSPFHCL